MYLDPRHKLEKAVSKEPHKVHLSNVYFRKGKLYATNGVILAKVKPATEATDVEGYVSIDDIKKSRRKDAPYGRGCVTAGGSKFTDAPSYPDMDIIGRTPGVEKVRFGINAKELYNLSQALGDDHITLVIRGHRTPIEVNSEYGEGVIMPLRTHIKPDSIR